MAIFVVKTTPTSFEPLILTALSLREPAFALDYGFSALSSTKDSKTSPPNGFQFTESLHDSTSFKKLSLGSTGGRVCVRSTLEAFRGTSLMLPFGVWQLDSFGIRHTIIPFQRGSGLSCLGRPETSHLCGRLSSIAGSTGLDVSR